MPEHNRNPENGSIDYLFEKIDLNDEV